MIDGMFGKTPFEKAQEGIAKRMIINSALFATKELVGVYEDINKGLILIEDDGDEETISLVTEALKDMNVANKELVALADMLERNMGISA
jgi:hypothetical protein